MTEQQLAEFKAAVLREAADALDQQGPDKIVLMTMEGYDPEFFVFHFSLSGPALERLDALVRSYGMEPNVKP